MPELHDLKAPAPAADFRGRLFERAEASARTSARRWRLAAIVATVAAIAAATGASVLALGNNAFSATATFDETLSCAVPVRAGIPVLDIGAGPTGWFFDGNGKRIPHAAQILVGAFGQFGNNSNTTFFAITSARGGYGSTHSPSCKPAAKISLARGALPLFDTIRSPNAGLGDGGNASCFTANRITARLHATIVRGTPVAAQLAVRSGKKQRPIAFIDWTPKRVAVYFSDDCHD